MRFSCRHYLSSFYLLQLISEYIYGIGSSPATCKINSNELSHTDEPYKVETLWIYLWYLHDSLGFFRIYIYIKEQVLLFIFDFTFIFLYTLNSLQSYNIIMPNVLPCKS